MHSAKGANAHDGHSSASQAFGPQGAVTTKHLAYMLAEQHHLGKKQSLEMMEELIGMITKHLKKGERVKIAGLGILQVRKRAARTKFAHQ